MMLLGIPGIGILSVIVFVCSYIPILGMWISTLPICVMALQAPEGGLVLIVLVVLMVSVVHAAGSLSVSFGDVLPEASLVGALVRRSR